MPKANPIQTNFTSGEVSPLMRGRVDTDKYRNGASELLNCVVRTQGGAWRRPGSRYLGNATNDSVKPFLFPFEFSDGDTYIVEFGGNPSAVFGESEIRFWKDDALLKGMDNTDVPAGGAPITHGFITAISNSSGEYLITLDTATDHTVQTGDALVIEGVVGTGNYEDVNGEWETEVTRVSATQIKINTGSAPSGAYTNGGWFSEVGHVLGAPWTAAHIQQLSFAQSADVLYIAHPSYQTRTLKRVGAHRFELAKYDPKDGPYLAGDATVKSQKIEKIYDGSTPIGIEISNHGLTTGDRVTVRDTEALTVADGEWVITVVDAHTFTLDGSTFVVIGNDGWVDIQVELTMSALTDRATMTDTAAQSTFTDTATDAGFYIEAKWKEKWSLFKIVTVASTEIATVDFQEHGLYALDPSIVLKAKRKNVVAATQAESIHPQVTLRPNAVPATRLKSNFSGVFTRQDLNKFVRLTQTGTGAGAVKPVAGVTSTSWYQITNVNDDGTDESPLVKIITTDNSALDWAGACIFEISGRTLTCTVTSNTEFFASTDVGRWIRLNMKGIWVRGEITAVADAKSVTVKIDWEHAEVPADIEDPDSIINDGKADTFKMGAWSDTTGWPGQVVFHEQRLTFARTDTEPQTVWMSVSGDFGNFEPTEADGTVLDDSAITYTIASQKINPITWLRSNKILLIGTEGGEWQARAASSISEPITPTNLSVTPQSTRGSLRYAYAQQIGNGVLFIQSAGQKVYDELYNFQVDGWDATDITVISEHILRKGTKGIQTAYQEEPVSTFWVLLSNGSLAALTFDRSQGVAAWHYHTLGGTDTVVESIAVTRDPTGTKDSLYLAVSRTILAGTVRYIEKLDPFYYPTSTTDKENLFYVDSGITVEQASSTTVEGLDHLEGQSVDVLADGLDVGPLTVDGSGEITLAVAATTIQVGLNYVSRLTTLPIEGGSPAGTSQGKISSIPKLSARFYLTQNVEVGDDASDLESRELGEALALFTGDEHFDINNTYSREPVYILQQSAPLPLVVLALFPQQWANE